MKKKNLLLIGHGKMLQGIIHKINTDLFNIHIITKTKVNIVPENDAISYFQLDVLSHCLPNEIVNKIDICICSLPPIELEKFNYIISQLSQNVKLIFLSSISVYIKNGGIIDEESLIHKNRLTECENLARNYFNQFSILRLGGLYGNNRHPIYSLQKKDFFENFNDNVHLIHHDDVQETILKIINNDLFDNEIYNLISDLRISKKDYYKDLSIKLNIDFPEINEINSSYTDKINNISNIKSKNKFKINYTNPLEYQGINK